MREFNFKPKKYYKVVTLVYLVVALFLAAILYALATREVMSNANTFAMAGTAMLIVYAIVQSALTDQLLQLSVEYYEFVEAEHDIEHNIEDDQELFSQIITHYDKYDEWIQKNWKILRNL